MKYTELETLVYNKLIDICYEGPESDCKDLSIALSLEVNTIKGVVGSLCKKGLIQVDEEERGMKYVLVGRKIKQVPKIYMTINPLIKNKLFSFGWDEYTTEQKESFKI